MEGSRVKLSCALAVAWRRTPSINPVSCWLLIIVDWIIIHSLFGFVITNLSSSSSKEDIIQRDNISRIRGRGFADARGLNTIG